MLVVRHTVLLAELGDESARCYAPCTSLLCSYLVEEVAQRQQERVILRRGRCAVRVAAQEGLVVIEEEAPEGLAEVQRLQHRVDVAGVVNLRRGRSVDDTSGRTGADVLVSKEALLAWKVLR